MSDVFQSQRRNPYDVKKETLEFEFPRHPITKQRTTGIVANIRHFIPFD